ncbi:LON peptidase substrate-binding domain-containing protein [Shewanella sp. GXUN23E]|uniref:LON peptidase substrate-binding domain-containing protein n=1 Tax=Shewanella sp. GXUN23E TaxID=3422498 RepID=UPI003D7CA87C
MQLPLFPLRICLLPGGYTQLRIFEPRYQRLVSESLTHNAGFGLCMLSDDGKQVLTFGTHCYITDFERLQDGMLGITVRGEQRFIINSMTTENDGLRRGTVSLLPQWPATRLPEIDVRLGDTLRELLKQLPAQLQHYNNSDFMDLSWLCQRWLEIIPVSAKDKQTCIAADDHHRALEFIRTLFQE